jgi:hypothetical protein
MYGPPPDPQAAFIAQELSAVTYSAAGGLFALTSCSGARIAEAYPVNKTTAHGSMTKSGACTSEPAQSNAEEK